MDPLSELHISSKGKGKVKDTLILVYPTGPTGSDEYETVLYKIHKSKSGFNDLERLASTENNACVTSSMLDTINRDVVALPEEGIHTKDGAEKYLDNVINHLTSN